MNTLEKLKLLLPGAMVKWKSNGNKYQLVVNGRLEDPNHSRFLLDNEGYLRDLDDIFIFPSDLPDWEKEFEIINPSQYCNEEIDHTKYLASVIDPGKVVKMKPWEWALYHFEVSASDLKGEKVTWTLGRVIELVSYPFSSIDGYRYGENESIMARMMPGDPTTMKEIKAKDIEMIIKEEHPWWSKRIDCNRTPIVKEHISDNYYIDGANFNREC